MASPTSDRPSIWLALSILTGLPLVLWGYKSLMLVLFQRKIIYMGYAPIGSRSEQLSDVPEHLRKGLECDEITISNGPRTSLSGLVIRPSKTSQKPMGVIVYFQGNAGNPLHRLPVFQALLSIHRSRTASLPPLEIIAVAPRSYWKSSPRRPTQTGILSDYRHVLQYILNHYPTTPIILYGHSLGGAISVCLASTLFTSNPSPLPTSNDKHQPTYDPRYEYVKGLILENPFTSIPDMVKALYPERWVPYKYLAPLAFDKWDALSAMRRPTPQTVLDTLKRNTLTLVSEKDEVVPPEMSHRLARAVGLEQDDRGLPRTVVIRDALHENAWQKRQWSIEMTRYIHNILQNPTNHPKS